MSCSEPAELVEQKWAALALTHFPCILHCHAQTLSFFSCIMHRRLFPLSQSRVYLSITTLVQVFHPSNQFHYCRHTPVFPLSQSHSSRLCPISDSHSHVGMHGWKNPWRRVHCKAAVPLHAVHTQYRYGRYTCMRKPAWWTHSANGVMCCYDIWMRVTLAPQYLFKL